jgi:hypothetical protein
MLMEARDPPFSPWLNNWNTLGILKKLYPSQSSSYRYVSVNISRKDPYPDSGFHELRI